MKIKFMLPYAILPKTIYGQLGDMTIVGGANISGQLGHNL